MINPSCPICGDARVHRSHSRHWLERAVRLLGARPFRCHQCNTRFARLGGSLLRIGDVNHAAQRLGIILMMMTAAAAILAGILWFSHKQAAYSPGESRINPPWTETLEA